MKRKIKITIPFKRPRDPNALDAILHSGSGPHKKKSKQEKRNSIKAKLKRGDYDV